MTIHLNNVCDESERRLFNLSEIKISEKKMQNLPTTWSLTQFLGAGFAPAEPVCEGFLHRGELILLSATAKTGKSLMAANLAIQVARGETSFLGEFPISKTKVLLIQTEINNFAYQQRLWEMMAVYGHTVPLIPDLLISDARIKIDTPIGRSTLEAMITEHKPGLLILDPLYTLHNQDEDKAKEITPVLCFLKELVNKHNIACLLIAHQGKRNEMDTRQVGHRHRGSSAMADVPDGSVSFQRTKVEKQATISFELRNHEAPTALTLELENSLWWRNLGEAKDGGTAQYSLDAIIEKNEMITRDAFIDRFCKRYNKAQRSAERFLGSMLQANRLIKDRDEGGSLFYARSDSVFASAIPPTPIEVADGGSLIGAIK